MYFNPRAPCGARPLASDARSFAFPFQSTRPLRGATLQAIKESVPSIWISIHAPLAGRDAVSAYSIHFSIISIHAPLAGRDRKRRTHFSGLLTFQSTRPLRGATSLNPALLVMRLFQSTRPLRGATSGRPRRSRKLNRFQSTRPLRGATAKTHKNLPAFLR